MEQAYVVYLNDQEESYIELSELHDAESNVPVQATFINADDTTGQIIFRLSDAETC